VALFIRWSGCSWTLLVALLILFTGSTVLAMALCDLGLMLFPLLFLMAVASTVILMYSVRKPWE